MQVLEEGRASFQNMNPAEESSSAASNVLFWWQLFTGTLLFSFALSCVSQFAQFYQMTIDQEASDKLREHLPPSVRTSLLSPGQSCCRIHLHLCFYTCIHIHHSISTSVSVFVSDLGALQFTKHTSSMCSLNSTGSRSSARGLNTLTHTHMHARTYTFLFLYTY